MVPDQVLLGIRVILDVIVFLGKVILGDTESKSHVCNYSLTAIVNSKLIFIFPD